MTGPGYDAELHPPRANACGAQPLRRRYRAGAATAALVAAVLGAACSSSPLGATSHVAVDPPGGGVVFSYPADGQLDVPRSARILVGFSAPLPAVDGTCAISAGQVTGTFCVEGPDGVVPGTVTVEDRTLAFAPAAPLAEGATYRVWARPGLLPGATNLPPEAPLFTFRARSTRIRAGEAASVLSVNGTPFAAAAAGALSFLDVAPVRLVFSEPLDPATVDAGAVRLVHAADGAAVAGVAVVHGVHLTFQPEATLVAGDAYRLELGAAVRDLGGEPVAPVSLAFTPRRTAVPGHDLYPLSLDVAPAWSGGLGQPRSRLGAMPVNANVLSSQLVGTNTMGVLPGGLDVRAGDPGEVMGSPLPMLIPRGQRLDLSPMSIRYGGALESGLTTGTLHFTMLTDAVGCLRRNPYRGDAQEPDDVQSPTWVDFTMDAVISGEDAHGNTIATQTVMGVRVLGLSTLDGDQLAIEQVGAIDFDLLGVDTAPVALALRFRTGDRAPVPALGLPFLVSSYPADGARDVPPADPIELNFSGPLDPARARDGIDVTLSQDRTPIPAHARLEGATVVVVPSRRLAEGATFTLSYAGLRGLGGADVAGGSLSFTTAVTSASAPVAPILTALVPGAPCALTGDTSAAPGHCAGGKTDDGGYQPFTLPANRDVRAVFSQPVDPASLTLGSTCGQGSVRVERLDARGGCAGVVPGSLVKRDRELRFVPGAPWTPGAAYRLTLVGGPDGRCDAGEICSRDRKPLNTVPLQGAATAGGGPDVVVAFTGAPSTPDTYQPLESDPIADQNGNGRLDASESANDLNRVAMEIAGFDGIITRAVFAGQDCRGAPSELQACSYLHATLPVSIGGVLPACPIDAQGKTGKLFTPPCIEVRVFPSAIVGTSVAMDTTAMKLFPFANLQTGMTVMRVRELGGPVHGYILREPGMADPVFVINQELYFDAPGLSIPLATHDLASKPLSVTLKGPVTFRPDGRMDVALRSIADVTIPVNIYALWRVGGIELRIPAGEMRVTLAGPPLR